MFRIRGLSSGRVSQGEHGSQSGNPCAPAPALGARSSHCELHLLQGTASCPYCSWEVECTNPLCQIKRLMDLCIITQIWLLLLYFSPTATTCFFCASQCLFVLRVAFVLFVRRPPIFRTSPARRQDQHTHVIMRSMISARQDISTPPGNYAINDVGC